MRTLNLGILAHIDAGKTSLTERLLHTAGVIDQIGRVDDGSTQTDSLALERQRGITIKSAVVSFQINDVTVNLIDTPGHPDFIAEVERVLSVLDGAVLVVSAVEGVQAQTRVLMRTLRRLKIPTLIFVNKIDRSGARHTPTLDAIRQKLTPAVVAMSATADIGTRRATATGLNDTDPGFGDSLLDLLTRTDDELLRTYVEEPAAITRTRLLSELARQVADSRAHPVYFGSAITGEGIADLGSGITTLLPTARGASTAPLSGTVFKVERGPAGEKVGYVGLFTGGIGLRDRVPFGDGREGKATSIRVFADGTTRPQTHVEAGQIAKLWGLGAIRIGDPVGQAAASADHHFAPPTLETVVVPAHPGQKGRLHAALAELAEQDPLINLRQDDIRQELSVSLYGEVQKEVIEATLAEEFGLEVGFRETTTICIERLDGTAEAAETIKQDGNPFLATIGLRVEPAPVGAGVSFDLEIELGALPLAFLAAIEETVRETLHQGLHGWQIPDCRVTLTRSGYAPRQGKRGQAIDTSISSTAGDFRHLTPLVLMDALRRAGTTVHEPMHRFRLEVPAATARSLPPVLSRLRAITRSTVVDGAVAVLEGELPAASVHTLERQLPGLTFGEGVLEGGFDHHAPVHGRAPSRARTDHNPLQRKEYLLHVVRRVPG